MIASPDPLEPARLDAVALALAAAHQPARLAAAIRTKAPGWPHVALREGLSLMDDGAGDEGAWRAEARRVLQRSTAMGFDVLWPAHPDYPAQLAAIIDPPLLLWIRGSVASLSAPMVALVGSRQATAAGRDVAFHLAADLAAAGVVVASGFARGVDAAAHRGALSTGQTVAVLGCGLDVAYPREHTELGTLIAGRGALVSEFAPGTPPRAHQFPLRNRVLAGLCHAVVVVQAAEKSGSLITARLALEQGRDVMAVPGDVRTGANRGGHALLRDGARLVERAADVLDELGWTSRVAPGAAEPDTPAARPNEPATLRALRAGDGDGLTLDDLAGATGRNSAEILRELLDLELAGAVGRAPGGRYIALERKW